MAQKIQTLFIDDLDGSEAEGTVRFALDGDDLEIDLSQDHEAELRAILGRYIEVARKASSSRPAARGGRGGGRPSRRMTTVGSRPEPALVRLWAKQNNMTGLNQRGRVPDDVNWAYESRADATQAEKVNKVVMKYNGQPEGGQPEPEPEPKVAPVEGYDNLREPQIRAKLRFWDMDTIRALIDYETREPVLAMLRSRAEKLAAASN